MYFPWLLYFYDITGLYDVGSLDYQFGQQEGLIGDSTLSFPLALGLLLWPYHFVSWTFRYQDTIGLDLMLPDNDNS